MTRAGYRAWFVERMRELEEREQAARVQARKALLRSARTADRMGLSAQEWQDKHAPQWALDELPQAEVTHMMEYVWQGEL